MITLITGAPGTGKSAALVAMLEELGQERQLYVNGIPDLLIPHEVLEEPERWPELVPDGAVIIIDEVQRVWRPRGPGQKVPDHVSMLETHRHRGLDVYVITQGPNLVDSNVRALVGRHVHLRDLGILGRWWYEWPECADNCRTSWKNAPIKKRYKLPKAIFSKYKSASLHVKPVRSFPWMLAVLIVALVLFAFMSWRAYLMISSKIAPQNPVSSPASSSVVHSSGASFPVHSKNGAPDERVDFMPRLSDRPWTAPAYDGLRQVVRLPYITGAICINDRCECFRGRERLLEVTSSSCLEWARYRPFNPYVPDVPDEKAGGRSGSSVDRTAAVPPGSSVGGSVDGASSGAAPML